MQARYHIGSSNPQKNMFCLYIYTQLASGININMLVQPGGEFGTVDQTVTGALKLVSYSQLSVQL